MILEMRGWNVFLKKLFLCLEVSESTRGFEYVKNCVDNPHFLDCPTIWVKDGKVGFFAFLS
jgi:hypothetical protein